MKRKIPEKTIQRLLIYYRYLYFLSRQGAKNISSKSLAALMEIKDSQVRKDLSYFGKLGKRGTGYEVLSLRNKIAEILEIEKKKKACIVGMGNLGSALAAYKGFQALGFEVVAVFDADPKKIGRRIKGYPCLDTKDLCRVIRSQAIDIAIITVPGENAQETAHFLDKCGIRAILNFAPVKLSLSRKVKIKNVDLAMELKTLSFYID